MANHILKIGPAPNASSRTGRAGLVMFPSQNDHERGFGYHPGMESDTRQEELNTALADADPRLLIALLVHHTAGLRWTGSEFAAMCLRHGHPDAPDQEHLSQFREILCKEVTRLAAEGRLWEPQSLPDDDVMLRLIRFVCGADLGPSYLGKLKSDFGLAKISSMRGRSCPGIVIVGGGFSGLSIAIELARREIPYRLLERHEGVGGVWFENSYPRCGVDSPSHVYSLTANAGRPRWSRYFARRDEILEYFQRTVDEFDLASSIDFDREVLTMDWTGAAWQIVAAAADGSEHRYSADVVVSAAGTLNQPKTPDIPGIGAFSGPVFHTARWRDDVSLKGKRIAMIGNGSSGFQVGPYLAEAAGHLTAFQRSPAWSAPNPRVAEPVEPGVAWLLTRIPDYARWHRFAMYWSSGDAGYENLRIDPDWDGGGISEANEKVRRRLTAYLQDQLRDRPDLIDKLLPDYPPYTKRMVVDNGWYRALRRDNVELVTTPIRHGTADGLVTDDGRHHDLDVIVYATGFHGTRFLYPMQVRGTSGRTPAEIAGRDDDIRGYLGIAMPDFPNLFSIFGPNSSIGHGGAAVHISECQAHYIAECISTMIDRQISTLEVRHDACADYNRKLDEDMSRMVWTEPGVRSRYRNEEGRIVTNQPWALQRFWEMTRTPILEHFTSRPTGDGTSMARGASA